MTSNRQSSDWRELSRLGEQLLGIESLSAQHERIIGMISQLIEGKTTLWLCEKLFRLPDWAPETYYPKQPPNPAMQQAYDNRQIVHSQADDGRHLTVIPLLDQDIALGVLQVERSGENDFHPEEIDMLQGVANIATLALLSSHRFAVERFRLEQLHLVRLVSAQVASVMHVDELAQRVVDLIRDTFQYYYVAIFTLEKDQTTLHFRASASARKPGQETVPIALEVALGQGLIGHAAQDGTEILCPDVRTEPRFRYLDSLPEALSEVVLPMKVDDRVLGVLDVQSNQVDAFHPIDLLVLRTLADNIARAVQAANLYSDVQRRADQLELLHEVSHSINATLDIETVMSNVAEAIANKLGYQYIHLYTVHHNRRQIIYEAGSGQRSEILRGDYVIGLDDTSGLVPYVARTGKALLVNDVEQEPRYRPSPLPPEDTRSELTVPLIFNDKVVGVLDIQSDQENAFSHDDLLLFESLADNLASAVHNADLYHSEQWRRQVADSLREVAVLLSANVGLDQVLEAILTELERNLRSDISTLWLQDENGLYLAAVHGADPDDIELAQLDNEEADSWLQMALEADLPLIRAPGDPIGPAGLVGGYDKNYSAIAAPLRIGDQSVGLLTLAHPTNGRYGHEAQAMTTTFASYAAVAIENARLYDSSQQQAYASAALLQIAQAVVSVNELDEILATIVRIMPILVGIDRCAIYLWDAEQEVFLPSKAYGLSHNALQQVWEGEYTSAEFPLLEMALTQNQPLVHPISEHDTPTRWRTITEVFDSKLDVLDTLVPLLMVLPLSIKGDVFGVMLVEEAPDGQHFRARRLEILNGIAQQAALAIQSDRLQREMVARERLQYEVQLARQIQETFLPDTLPQRDGWSLAARWKTARQVGGDFYDVLELPNGKLGLFIADVADKGVPAALFMALTRTLIRAAALESGSPAEVMYRVNDLLYPDCQQGMFVTAAYAVLDTAAGKLTYANAGHNPPLLVQNGKIIPLTRTGIALGVVEELEISEETVAMSAGDCLLMYTDGLTEAFDTHGNMFGEDRLLSLFSVEEFKSAEGVLDSIEKTLDEFLEDNLPADDLTMLALKKTETQPAEKGLSR